MTVKEFNNFCLKNYKDCEIYVSDINCKCIAMLSTTNTQYFYSLNDFPTTDLVSVKKGLFTLMIKTEILKKIGNQKDDILSIETLDTLIRYFSKIENENLQIFISHFNKHSENLDIDFYKNDKHILNKNVLPLYFEKTIKELLELNPNNLPIMY